MDFLRKASRGEAPLSKVFWLGLALTLLLLAICSSFMACLPIKYSALPLLIFWTWFTAYVRMLWKCAFNAQWRGWGYIARSLIVLLVLGIAISTVMISKHMHILQSFSPEYKAEEAARIEGLQKEQKIKRMDALFEKACQERMQKQAVAQKIDAERYIAEHAAEYTACQAEFKNKLDKAIEEYPKYSCTKRFQKEADEKGATLDAYLIMHKDSYAACLAERRTLVDPY